MAGKEKNRVVSCLDVVFGAIITLFSGALSVWLGGRASRATAPFLTWIHWKQLGEILAVQVGASVLLYLLGQSLQKRLARLDPSVYANQVDWVPFWLGIVERSLIMIGLAGGHFDSAVFSATGGWITLKAIHGWQLSIGTKEGASPEKTAVSLLGLLLSVVSAAFGVAAGFVVR